VVDHEHIAVGPVGVAEPEIDAYGILFDGVHLREHRSRQEAVERVAGVERSDMDVVAPAPKAKVVPRLHTCERDPWRKPVVASDPAFVQGSVVVGPESLEEAVGVPLAEVGSVSELVPVEVVDTGRDEYVPEDIEWCRQPLN